MRFISKVFLIIIVLFPLIGCDSDSSITRLHWAYLIDQGSGARIERSSDASISVVTPQPGEYIVTFPGNVKNIGCTATLNNSVGFITATPGDNSGLAANKVRVLTMNRDNSFGPRDFTVAVYWMKEE